MTHRPTRRSSGGSTAGWGWILVIGGLLYVAGASRWPWVRPVGTGPGPGQGGA